MTECINEEILKEFLEKNRAEVIKVCLYEYNQEEHMKFVREEGFRQGHEQGTKSTQLENIKNLMKNTGWNAKEAMKALGIPEEEQEKYQSKLQESKRRLCKKQQKDNEPSKENPMNGKKLYIIYAAELLFYLLFHFIQIQKGLFGQVFFTGILAALFLWAVVFLLLFLVRKIRKKERWKWWEFLFLLLQGAYSIWQGYEFLIGILFF